MTSTTAALQLELFELAMPLIAKAHAATTSTLSSAFVRVAVELAQAVQTHKTMTGAEKLKVVQTVLRECVKESAKTYGISDDVQTALYKTIDTVVPEVIAIAIDVSRSKYSFKKPTVGCVARFVALFCRAAAIVEPVSSVAMAVAVTAEAVSEKESVAEVAETVVAAAVVVPDIATEIPAAPTEPAVAVAPSESASAPVTPQDIQPEVQQSPDEAAK